MTPGRLSTREVDPRVPDVALHPSSTAALLVVFAGLPGAGKSTLARLVAQQRDAVWLRVDTVEASLLKAGIPQSFETGLAEYLAVRDVAAEHLRLGRDVVVDAVNGVEAAREMWRTLATESQAVLSFVMVTCSDPDEHRRRVEARADPTPPLPSPSWAEVVDREFVPWGDPVLRVDSLVPPGENVARILNYLAR